MLKRTFACFTCIGILALSGCASPAPGRDVCDLNGDGASNTALDRQVMYRAMGKSPGEDGYLATADFDGDGIIAGSDFELWLGHCGTLVLE